MVFYTFRLYFQTSYYYWNDLSGLIWLTMIAHQRGDPIYCLWYIHHIVRYGAQWDLLFDNKQTCSIAWSLVWCVRCRFVIIGVHVANLICSNQLNNYICIWNYIQSSYNLFPVVCSLWLYCRCCRYRCQSQLMFDIRWYPPFVFLFRCAVAIVGSFITILLISSRPSLKLAWLFSGVLIQLI